MTSPIIRIKSIKVEGRPCSINEIIPVGQGQAWIKGQKDKMLTLIDNTGKIIRYSHKICSDDSFIMDAVKYGNDILVIGYGEHKIIRLRSDGSNPCVFYDAGTHITMGLSISPENHVVMSLKSKTDTIDPDTKVLIIASSGEVMKAIERDTLGNPVFDRPQRLVTTQTGKIIVVDNVTTPNKLVCVKQSGVIEFRRDIYLDGQAVTISRIVYKDKKLYATDKQSGKAFVMNEDGTGAKCLLFKEAVTLPSAINFDIEGHLLVGCWERRIHTFKFPQSDIRELRKRKPKETITEMVKEEEEYMTPAKRRKRKQTTKKDRKRKHKGSTAQTKGRRGKQSTEHVVEANRKAGKTLLRGTRRRNPATTTEEIQQKPFHFQMVHRVRLQEPCPLPKTRNIIAVCLAFTEYMDTHHKYKLYKVWPGYVNKSEGKRTSTKEVIVAICNELPFPSFYDFQEKNIIWREKNKVSEEAISNVHYEDVELTSTSDLDPENIQKLFSSHRNLTMVHLSSYKSIGFSTFNSRILPGVCVALYCRVKGVIPLYDEPFPDHIQGFRTDVREGYFSFGGNEKLKSGSEIICKKTNSAGTVGPFYEEAGRLHFITCAHLVAKVTQLSKMKKSPKMIEHIPVYDDIAITREVGTVQRWCFSCGNSAEVSVDAALVQAKDNLISMDGSLPRHTLSQLYDAGYETGNRPRFRESKIAVIDESNRRWDCLKFGAKSGLTIGSFKLNGIHVKQDAQELTLQTFNTASQLQGGQRVVFYGQYAVAARQEKDFFLSGDSGSLCGIVKDSNDTNLQPFGLAIGLTSFKFCVVTPLRDVFKGLGLDLEKGIKIFEPQPDNNESDSWDMPTTSNAAKSFASQEDSQSLLQELRKMRSESNTRFDHIDKELVYTQNKLESLDKLENDMESVKNVVFSPGKVASLGTDQSTKIKKERKT